MQRRKGIPSEGAGHPQAAAPCGSDRQVQVVPPAQFRVSALDLTPIIVRRTCVEPLANYSARILKVEPPEGNGMPYAGAKRETSMVAMFVRVTRGKQFVTIDLKCAEDPDLVLRWVGRTQVVINNMGADAATQLALDSATIVQHHPSALYPELSGYGSSGPCSDRPRFDHIIQVPASVAILLPTVIPDGPRFQPMLLVDRITGFNAAQQVLAAFYRRPRTSKGYYRADAIFEEMNAFVLADHQCHRSFEPPAGGLGSSRFLTPNQRDDQRSVRLHQVAVIANLSPICCHAGLPLRHAAPPIQHQERWNHNCLQ